MMSLLDELLGSMDQLIEGRVDEIKVDNSVHAGPMQSTMAQDALEKQRKQRKQDTELTRLQRKAREEQAKVTRMEEERIARVNAAQAAINSMSRKRKEPDMTPTLATSSSSTPSSSAPQQQLVEKKPRLSSTSSCSSSCSSSTSASTSSSSSLALSAEHLLSSPSSCTSLPTPFATSGFAPVVLVTTLQECKAAVKELQQHKVLAVDCEGVNLGRNGQLTLVQVGTEVKVFLFDLLERGMPPLSPSELLHTDEKEPDPEPEQTQPSTEKGKEEQQETNEKKEEENVTEKEEEKVKAAEEDNRWKEGEKDKADTFFAEGGLKALLEDEHILKVFHDCRGDSDALFHQFQVALHPVFDTQVAYAVAKRQQFSQTPIPVSLNTLLRLYATPLVETQQKKREEKAKAEKKKQKVDRRQTKSEYVERRKRSQLREVANNYYQALQEENEQEEKGEKEKETETETEENKRTDALNKFKEAAKEWMIKDKYFWKRRPMTELQLGYAAEDVLFLTLVHRQLNSILDSNNRKLVASLSEKYVKQVRDAQDIKDQIRFEDGVPKYGFSVWDKDVESTLALAKYRQRR
ncbi:piRNA biogenesis protein EXD1-like [Balamuthia mandrillaris]